MRHLTFCVLVLLVTFSGSEPVQAQLPPVAQLFVESSPSGAVVRQDGKVFGTTPFNLTLPLGTYTFEISLAGFPTRMERFALLKAGMSATLHARMTSPLQPANWTRLLPSGGVLVSDYDLFGSNNRTDGTYNADTGAVLYSEYVQNIVEDASLQQLLGAISPLYRSPTGNYLLYKSAQSRTLLILETATDTVFDTGIFYLPEAVEWSADGSRGWIIANNRQFGAFFFIKNNHVEAFSAQSIAKTKTGMTLGLVHILSYPTADRKVLWAMVPLEGTSRMVLSL